MAARALFHRSLGIIKLKQAMLAGLLTICGATFAQVPNGLTQLPPPDPMFSGVALPSLADSTSQWPGEVTAPTGAPNVLLIMSDDVGFSASSTFGGPVPTPTLDSLANSGLSYNNFHTTAMCSPTRAALLTGRNHHRVGTGALTNVSMGFPGYWSKIPRSTATLGRILKGNGYSTSWFGKNHNVPPWQEGEAGPFDVWPTGMGFEYFYGFLGADANQWKPRLYENTVAVDTRDRDPDLLLDKDLADKAIKWLHNQKGNAPERPFLMYFAPGTAHAPHHAPKDWIAKFKGQFDQGWDKLRQETFARQQAAGIIPAGTVLTPRMAEIPAWDTLGAKEKRVYSRYMEVFAATLAYQDHQIGRLLAELERMGERDNTLVIYVQGDNGASGEAGPEGAFNELQAITQQEEPGLDWVAEHLDELGGPNSYPTYPVGWAWAVNTPFRYMKQVASHLGGTRNGLVISWPKHIGQGAALRSQYHHVIDIVPTVLEVAGIAAPKTVDGIEQQPFDGVSMAYSFDNAEAADRHTTQYYELLGNRAIYHQGWLASTTPGRMPWQDESTSAPEDYPWELYNLTTDFSQSKNLAAEQPEKLADMKALWEQEAKRNNVYPLRASLNYKHAAKYRYAPPPRKNWLFWGGDVSLAWGSQPMLSGRNFIVQAEVGLAKKTSGVILATGSHIGGWSFYLHKGVPVVYHAASQQGEQHYRIAAKAPLPAGDASLRFEYSSDKPQPMVGGTVKIWSGDALLAEGRIEGTALMANGFTETFDIGRDTGAAVSPDYDREGHFDGTIHKVEVRF